MIYTSYSLYLFFAIDTLFSQRISWWDTLRLDLLWTLTWNQNPWYWSLNREIFNAQSWVRNDATKKIDQRKSLSINSQTESIVSFIEDVPVYLNDAIRKFIDEHPNWDQHRLMQAAISGYLLEKGVTSIEMRRFYSQSMFCKKSMRGSIWA